MTKRVSKKDLIVASAREHFSKYGYELSTLENIAKECGITKPAIYYHFKDKAALYKAVVCPEFTSLAEKIEQYAQEGTPIERLERYITTFGEFLISNPTFSAIFARELANGSINMPDDCIEKLSRTIKQLVLILQKGEQEGVLQPTTPFLVQMMIVTPLISYQTTKPLRAKITQFAQDEHMSLEPNFSNIIETLSEKIIKGLQC